MTKTEAIVRSVLGPSGGDVRPLVFASDLFAQRMFVENIPMDDIKVTKEIYPYVAKLLKKRAGAATKSVERLANRCWDLGDRERLNEIAGKVLRTCPVPRDVLVYFAFYSYLDIPFYKAIEQRPALLF